MIIFYNNIIRLRALVLTVSFLDISQYRRGEGGCRFNSDQMTVMLANLTGPVRNTNVFHFSCVDKIQNISKEKMLA